MKSLRFIGLGAQLLIEWVMILNLEIQTRSSYRHSARHHRLSVIFAALAIAALHCHYIFPLIQWSEAICFSCHGFHSYMLLLVFLKDAFFPANIISIRETFATVGVFALKIYMLGFSLSFCCLLIRLLPVPHRVPPLVGFWFCLWIWNHHAFIHVRLFANCCLSSDSDMTQHWRWCIAR